MNNLAWLVLSSLVVAAFWATIGLFFAAVVRVVAPEFGNGALGVLVGTGLLVFLLLLAATSLNFINHWINLLRNKR